jgi:hypothetical protein
VSAAAIVLAIVAMLLVPAARASDLIGLGATDATLEVHGGRALATFTEGGLARHVLVWGAVNARTPVQGAPQVRFSHDYSGRGWRTFVDQCRRYDGPALAYLVAACKAPDGSYWALQSWQRNLPHRGVAPWTAAQAESDLRISHWTGPLASVELYTDWAFAGEAHDIFGRLSYDGVPVYGFHTTSQGAPTDSFGRSLYIDTFDSAYGPGWKRETSIVFHKPTGAFCYSFWPTHDVSLPGRPPRPAGDGTRYRISVVGPGVTPDVVAEAADPGEYNAAAERQRDALFTSVTAGDRFCATQH